MGLFAARSAARREPGHRFRPRSSQAVGQVGLRDADVFGAAVVLRNTRSVDMAGFVDAADAFGGHVTLPGVARIAHLGLVDADVFGRQVLVRPGVVQGLGFADPAGDTFGVQSVVVSPAAPAFVLREDGASRVLREDGGRVLTELSGRGAILGQGFVDPDFFGIQAVVPVPRVVTQAGFTDGDAFGSATTGSSVRIVLQAGHAEGADAFGAQTVARGAVSVSQAGLSDGDAFGAQTVARGTVTVTQVGFAEATGDLFGTAVVSGAALLFDEDFSAGLALRDARPAGANKLRNSAFAGAVAGTTGRGVEPENMAFFAFSGLDWRITGTGTATVDGQTVGTVDVRIFGTAAAGAEAYLVFETTDATMPSGERFADAPLLGGVPAAAGETWTFAVSLQRSAGTAANIDVIQIVPEFADAASAGLDAWWDTKSVGTSLARFSTTLGPAPAGTRHARFFVYLLSTGGAVDITLRLAAPDIRLGSSAGTHVPTSSATPGTWLSRTRWGADFQEGGQIQHYVDTGPRGTLVSGGTDPFAGTASGVLSVAASATPSGAVTTRAYVSGVVSTFRSFSRQYGYFEARMRFPAGSGLLPRFWLLPDDPVASQVADIAVVEWPGGSTAAVYGTARHGPATGPTADQRTVGVAVSDITSSFHTYGVEWTASQIRFYLDRSPYGTAIATDAALQVPMHINLGLAVGGDWAGSTVSGLPAALEVDWVRVWDVRPF